MRADDFISKIAPRAVEDMRKTKVLASLTIAQAALESAWGESSLTRECNNLFGIKGSYNGQSRPYQTKEFRNGVWVTEIHPFRVYPSWSESIADHSNLFHTVKLGSGAMRYAPLIGETDYIKACRAVQSCGYATDPKYADKLIGMIEQYNLVRYDKEALGMIVDTMKPDDANKVIAFLGAAWGICKDKESQKEFNRLANELRRVSGQKPQ